MFRRSRLWRDMNKTEKHRQNEIMLIFRFPYVCVYVFVTFRFLLCVPNYEGRKTKEKQEQRN